MTIGPDGLDALQGMPLSALTRSPRFQCADSEMLGPDRLDTFVRV
jgi:hypothetical protein